MTAQVLAAREGRPSIAGLQASLERAREVNVNLALELRFERREGRLFADRVAAAAERLSHLSAAQNPRLVLNVAGELALSAAHRQAQIGSVVL